MSKLPPISGRDCCDLTLTQDVKQFAHAVGFDLVAVTSAEPFPAAEHVIRERIAAGLFAGLPWFTVERAAFATTPTNHLATARSILALGLSYLTDEGYRTGSVPDSDEGSSHLPPDTGDRGQGIEVSSPGPATPA
ncbi:MAG: hypothetical protein HYY04_09610, partial [Chloroflexi bacterium]|nr:hypothetical protein [Chloroflexota bacterium]